MQEEIDLLDVALLEGRGVERIDFFKESCLGGDLEIWQIRRWVRLETYICVLSFGLFLVKLV